MMCCNRCGDILSSGKCRKCGGKPVASIIASSGLNSPTIGKEASIKIADKWQSQYASGILGSQHTVFDAKDHQPQLIVQSTASTPLRSTTSKRHSTSESLLNGSVMRKQQQAPLSLSLQNTCTNCDKQLVYDAPSFIESGSHYCKECHISLFSKGPCTKCRNPVFHQRDAFIEYDAQVWHKDCFRCHNCFVTLGHAPMVDLNARPCCERCLIAQSGEAKQAKLSYPPPSTSNNDDSTAASTPGLRDTVSSAGSAAFWIPRTPPPSSRPRIDSVLFNQYQKTLQNDQQQPTRNSTPPLPPLTPSTLSPAGSIRSSASASPVSISSISPSPSPLSSSSSSTRSELPFSPSTPPPPSVAEAASAAQRRLSQQQKPQARKPLNKRASSISVLPSPSLSSPKETNSKKPSSDSSAKKTCAGCDKIITQGTKVKIQSCNDDIYFHHDCLICSGCQGPFPDSRCILKNNKAYHLKCQPLSSNPSTDEQRHQYQCHACKKSIKERCYVVGSRSYHPECFQCYQCHVALPQVFYEAFNEPHCESCINNTDPNHYHNIHTTTNDNNNKPAHRRSSMQIPQPQLPPTRQLHRNRPSSSTSTPLLSSQRSLDHPSSVLMHRTRALPKLGGSKTCPRCHTSIAVMEEALGPKATKWHKKCLRCAGCSKQMDSMARMSTDADGKWLVHCRGCMDTNGSKTRFVR